MGLLGKLAASIVTSSNRVETLRRRSNGLARLLNAVEAKVRVVENQGREFPQIRSVDGEHNLKACIRQSPALWSSIALVDCPTPGMLTREECEYYSYIGQFFSGIGEVVELGPWLGRSTFYILHGLSTNPNFTKKLHVYDDFVWRSSWMDQHVPESQRLPNHQDFQFLFEKFSGTLLGRARVQRRKFVDYDGNSDVEQLLWDGSPVEFIYVDCGRTFEANEAWWKVFRDSFIPGKTLIMLEDWGTHRDVPTQWFNQIKEWVESKGTSLQPVHELAHGGVATFLFTGPPTKT